MAGLTSGGEKSPPETLSRLRSEAMLVDGSSVDVRMRRVRVGNRVKNGDIALFAVDCWAARGQTDVRKYPRPFVD